MKLLYLANNRIPSEKANSLQIMQMCRAFLRQGADVQLVVPQRVQPKVMRAVLDPFGYYGIEERFPIVHLPCVDALEVAPDRLQPLAFALQSGSFTAALAGYLATHGAELYYSRDPLSTVVQAATPRSIRRRCIFESHTFPRAGRRRSLHVWAMRRLGKVVAITRGLADEYQKNGIPEERLLVAPDAVDLDRFKEMPTRTEARSLLGIAADRRIVGYAGHLYRWKGVHTLALASRWLPPDFLVYIIGGTDADLASFRRFLAEEKLDRVVLVGQVPPARVIPYLAAADILALPNSGSDPISSLYTSPMKLFEYLAAGRPVVASRLPSLQEVLRDRENALLVEPDDPQALAQGILAVGSSPEMAGKLAKSAQEEAQLYSWDSRAKSILDFAAGR